MATFVRVSLNPVEWGKILSTYPDANVFQTPEWVSFVAETQKAEPVLAILKEGNETLGYFTGLIIRKFGMKILGSPFRGWSTPYGIQFTAIRTAARCRGGDEGFCVSRTGVHSF